MKQLPNLVALFALELAMLMMGCNKSASNPAATNAKSQAEAYFKVDASIAGSISGVIRYTGPRPKVKSVDMSDDPSCVDANRGKVYSDSIVIGPRGGLANAFIYIQKGLEGKTFAPPPTPVIIEQKGCMFRPHVLGLQTGQTLQIVNSDPVTHNIHPMPQLNREWNHTQGSGDPPMAHKFTKAEVMVPVKCNIHGWMHAYVGVLDHPYFAVSGEDGRFAIPSLPPGTYTLAAWTQTLGVEQQTITVSPRSNTTVDFTFRGK